MHWIFILFRELNKKIAEENLQLARQQKSHQEYLNRVLYKNKSTAAFFEQFNKGTRWMQSVVYIYIYTVHLVYLHYLANLGNQFPASSIQQLAMISIALRVCELMLPTCFQFTWSPKFGIIYLSTCILIKNSNWNHDEFQVRKFQRHFNSKSRQ